MHTVGYINTGERFACERRSSKDCIVVNRQRVGIADMDTLVPEVEDDVLLNGDIVAIFIIDRTHGIVTTVEETAVNRDEMVSITQKDKAGIGSGGSGFL